ncbi:MAG: hypothetical protein ACYCRD_11075 [Leptospirillum sp.]
MVVLTLLKYAFSGSVEDVLRALKETGGSFDETFLFGVLNYAIRVRIPMKVATCSGSK